MKFQTQRIFENLKGDWDFHRVLSKNGIVKGVAHFKDISKYILNYREEGLWELENHKTYAVFKEYQYQYNPSSDKISVYFLQEPKKIFLEIDIVPLKNEVILGKAQHLCLADHYQALYHFINPNKFRLNFQVKGPKKDYCSETVFKKTNIHIQKTLIHGIDLHEQTRCLHYSSELDVIAILFKCCLKFFACYECHQALADHAAQVWQANEHEVKAILCGGCGNTLTINHYLSCNFQCPFCQINFNPGCKTHYCLYFQF